jgi:hypothetical protein
MSVFEITLGNWAPITRFLHDNVSEWFGVVVIVYHCLVSFGVVMVIRGVFLAETIQAAESNDDLMISRQMRTRTRLVTKMHKLFLEADDSGTGFVTREQFIDVVEDARVKAWLSAMGIEVSDAGIVFEMVDEGDHRISVHQFVDGLTRLKGAARTIDLVQVLRLVRNCVAVVQDIGDSVGIQKNHTVESLKPSFCYRHDEDRFGL